MVKYIVLAVILLVSGCTANNNKAAEKTPSMKSQSAAPTPGTPQASSTSTSTPHQGSVTTKEVPNGIPSNIWDMIQPPTGNPITQAPTNPSSQVPPNNQAPANPTYQAPSNPSYPTPATPSPTGQAPQGSSEYAQQVLNLVNQERSKAGLGALTMSPELANMALVKAQDMINNNYFDHNSPTHGSPFDMMNEFGITYNTAGENIAKGQTSASQVMNDWMNSPGHRANILNGSYTKIGVGYYNNAWVQEFTG